jgi:hypothetical protein
MNILINHMNILLTLLKRLNFIPYFKNIFNKTAKVESIGVSELLKARRDIETKWKDLGLLDDNWVPTKRKQTFDGKTGDSSRMFDAMDKVHREEYIEDIDDEILNVKILKRETWHSIFASKSYHVLRDDFNAKEYEHQAHKDLLLTKLFQRREMLLSILEGWTHERDSHHMDTEYFWEIECIDRALTRILRF